MKAFKTSTGFWRPKRACSRCADHGQQSSQVWEKGIERDTFSSDLFIAMSSLELKVPPLVLLVVCGLLMSGVSFISPSLSFQLPYGVCIATVLVVAGAGIALAGVLAFRMSGTTVNPTTPEKSSQVVSVGIYRFTRNPMYFGFLLMLAGWAAYLSNAASALALPAFVVYMNKFQIEPEERVLLAKFGVPFKEYMDAVRRWV